MIVSAVFWPMPGSACRSLAVAVLRCIFVVGLEPAWIFSGFFRGTLMRFTSFILATRLTLSRSASGSAPPAISMRSFARRFSRIL